MQESPPHTQFLVFKGCSSPFMRLAPQHLTALRTWCDQSTVCLIGENPTCSVPAILGCKGCTVIATTINRAMLDMTIPLAQALLAYCDRYATATLLSRRPPGPLSLSSRRSGEAKKTRRTFPGTFRWRRARCQRSWVSRWGGRPRKDIIVRITAVVLRSRRYRCCAGFTLLVFRRFCKNKENVPWNVERSLECFQERSCDAAQGVNGHGSRG